MMEDEFISRLRKVIDETPGLTPSGLSVKAGLDNSTIRGMFSGKTKHPRFDTAYAICRALGTTVEAFMSDRKDPEAQHILHLLSQLSLAERRQLLGYGEALRDAQAPAPQGSPPAAPKDRNQSLDTPPEKENIAGTFNEGNGK